MLKITKLKINQESTKDSDEGVVIDGDAQNLGNISRSNTPTEGGVRLTRTIL